jgi:hypothetical protein
VLTDSTKPRGRAFAVSVEPSDPSSATRATPDETRWKAGSFLESRTGSLLRSGEGFSPGMADLRVFDAGVERALGAPRAQPGALR